MLHRRSQLSGGYSLIEMLVVVAIVGIMSMVSVPMFMNFVRSNKMKSTMRQFMTDLRTSRQRAITENHPTMISFRPGPALRDYIDFDGTVGAGGVVTYALARRNPRKELDNITYFPTSTDPCIFDDVITSPVETNGWNDIIFMPNGTIGNIPGPPCTAPAGQALAGKAFITTDYNVPKKMYTIEGHPTGTVKAK